MPPACRFDQQLPHGARSDTFEVKTRHCGKPRRFGQFDPRLVHQGRWTERDSRIAALYRGSQPPQLFIRQAEQVVQGAALLRRFVRPRRARVQVYPENFEAS